MPSILADYSYDIFISYRQKDNKVDGWVTAFVASLKAELDATLKNPVSIYFDENPHDGLLETHQVNATLNEKLRCIVFMPIVSQTYCDPESYAWQHEFVRFLEIAKDDRLGPNVVLANGNVVSRVLPIQIHELDAEDRRLIDSSLGGPMRAIPFIYTAPGVNRPLRPNEDHPENNKNHTVYRDQINKVANALKELGSAVVRTQSNSTAASAKEQEESPEPAKSPWLKVNLIAAAVLILTVAAYYMFRDNSPALDASKSSIAVIPFRNNTGDPGMNHYGVGIASEVSTQLGLTKQFDFISSLQATIQYQQSDASPKSIGEELGVTHILTGMYQTAGDNIQVLVELMDASGKVVWSIPYKTQYKDIFEVQASIAKKVMDKFSVQNAGETLIVAPNLEAYAHMIRGLEIVLKSNVPSDRMKAIAEYQQAIALDSGFIEPWAGIIEEYCYYYFNRGREDVTLEMIQPYMQYVQDNFPDDWKKKSVMATYEYWALAHYQKGLDLFLEVLDEAPQDASGHSMVSAIYRRQLKLKESLDHIAVSLKQSPGGVIYWNELVAIASLNGDYENAIRAASTIYRLNETLASRLYFLRLCTGSLDKVPEAIRAELGLAFQADQLMQQRDFQGLLALVTPAPDSLMTSGLRLYYQAVAHYLLRQDDQAKRIGAKYLSLNDRNEDPMGFAHRLTILAILGKEQEFKSAVEFRDLGRDIQEDIAGQWATASDMLRYYVFSGNYPEADKKLKQINKDFPQVGDFCWLNLPLYDRIKAVYPAFRETMDQLQLPPKIMDDKLIKM
jgi:TolB-like protein